MTTAVPDQQAPPWITMGWPSPREGTVPYWIYTDPRVLDRERARLFAPNWNYVGLLAELDRPGSYMRSFCGPVPVVVTRDKDGTISCLVNRCSHRGVEFVQEMRGHAPSLACHSALTHDAEDGTSTPMLMARSRHTPVRSLVRYAKVSVEALQRHQADRDPAQRH